MHTVRNTRVAVGRAISILFITLSLPLMHAHADTTPLDPASCNTLYGLPAGTITSAASLQYLNPTVCAAMIDLISRYNPGPSSKVGLSNAKVTGITSLNTTFAVNLDNMLKAADAAGYHITINSAYRTIAGEIAANAKGFSGNPSASMHTKGLAADLQYPNDSNVTGECDGSASNLSAAYKWVLANDSTYHIGQYDQLHAHVSGECNHVEAIAGSTQGGLGPGGGSAALGGSTETQSTITSAPGLGSTPTAGQTAGQIVSQDTSCMVSADPIVYVTIPAGSTYPSGCLNNQSGLLGTSCPAGSTLSNGYCIQQTCPSGYTLSGTLCLQNQTTTQTPAASTASTPASTASAAPSVTAPASTATTVTTPANTITTTPTTVTQPSTVAPLTTAAPSTLASPTLVTTLSSTSTAGLIQSLANPQITTTAATETPANLNNGLDQVSQLSAPALPGVTYAQPASSLFAGSSGSGNGITTSGGSGYTTTDGGVSATGAGPTGTIAAGGTTAPSQNGVSTFQSDDTSGTVTSAPASSAAAPTTTFASNALSILATLKAQVIGALNFLKSYLAPASSNASAQGSE